MQGLISVCLVVRNEEQLLANSLRSVAPIADEVIVIDTGSTDRTVEVAHSFGARVLHRPWTTYAATRNAYIEAARCRWILVLDADEAIAARDLDALARLVRHKTRIGYRLTVRNYTETHDLMWRWSPNDGRYRSEERFSQCPGWMKTIALRLFRNLPGVSYLHTVSAHPTPLESLRQHRGQIEDRDDVVIHHFQHLKGGSRFIAGKQRKRLPMELAHIKRFPSDTYARLNAARTLFADGRDAQAVRLLKAAVRLDAGFHDAWQLLGMIDFSNARFRAAEQALRRATEIDPASSDAWALLGMVLVEAGRSDEAASALRRAIRLHPGHLLAHNTLGVLFEDLGDRTRARRQFAKAVRLHPTFKPAVTNLRRVARRLSKARA